MTHATATNTTAVALNRATALAADILAKREQVLTAGIKSRPRRSIHASQIPDCARQGVYEFSHWDQKKMWDARVQALMNAGHVQEAAYKAELRQLGYDLCEDQAPLSKDMGDRYGIHGYIDTKIKWDGVRIPVEIKAVNPNTFDRIRNGVDGVEDMKSVVYMRKYIRQGLVYMLGNNEEAMVFALTDSRGAWKFIPMAIDLDEAERVLKIAEEINRHVAAKTLPDRIPYDNDVCGFCNFIHVCLPDIANDPTVKFLNNPKLEKDLDHYAEIKPVALESNKLWDSIKETFKGLKGSAAVGKWFVTAKETKAGVRLKVEVLGKPEEAA